MEYNDSQILSNYEQMARAYTNSLTEKGFVFVRLDSSVPANEELVNRIAENMNCLWKIYVEASLSRSFTKNKLIYATLAQNTSVILDEFKKLYPNAVFSNTLPPRIRQTSIPKVAILTLTELIKDIWTLSGYESEKQKTLLNMANDLLLQINTLAGLLQ